MLHNRKSNARSPMVRAIRRFSVYVYMYDRTSNSVHGASSYVCLHTAAACDTVERDVHVTFQFHVRPVASLRN